MYNLYREIKQYWGEYLESLEDFDGAMKYYEECGDIHSLVRVLQFSGNVERAIEVVDESQDKAAAYHMARHLSNSDHVSILFVSCIAYECIVHVCIQSSLCAILEGYSTPYRYNVLPISYK